MDSARLYYLFNITTVLSIAAVNAGAWFPFEQQEYSINKTRQTYADANNTCHDEHAYLVTFIDITAYFELAEKMNSSLEVGDYWIGASDVPIDSPNSIGCPLFNNQNLQLSEIKLGNCSHIKPSICGRRNSSAENDPIFKKRLEALNSRSAATNKMEQRLNSLPDRRTSSTVIGIVGICTIVTMFGIILISDLAKVVCYWFKQYSTKRTNEIKEN